MGLLDSALELFLELEVSLEIRPSFHLRVESSENNILVSLALTLVKLLIQILGSLRSQVGAI
jgi:hypothetical protein